MHVKYLFLLFFIACFYNPARAQLCQGSLGDPIVNTNFGQGLNPGPPLSAATTTYQYVTNDCPSDGFYTVRNNSSACFGNSWYSFTSDHTGNANGYFMLVNASILPSAFYLDTVRGLCGSTTYEFAAWIMNVILPASCGSNSIQPNLTFSIEKTDGSVLQTYNTGSIPPAPSASWKQYGFFFTTPAAVTDIVLRIFNNSQGGCGNDLALDDITFRPCGPLLTPAITGNATSSVSLCEGIGGSYTFTCTVSGGFNTPVFQWQERVNAGSWTDIAGANSLSLTSTFPATTPVGNYEFRLAVAESGNMGSAQCRIASQPLLVIIQANPVTAASNNGPACTNSIVTLTATGGIQYQWTGPNGYTGSGSPLPLSNLLLNQAGKYYVTVTNAAGCFKNDSTTLFVNPSPVATTSFANASLCAGDSIPLIAGGGIGYTWIPATGLSNALIFNPMAAPTQTTVYQAIVSNAFSCKDTASSTLTLIFPPVVNAGSDKLILKGQRIPLAGSVTGQGVNFLWSPPDFMNDIYALNSYVNPPTDIRYILSAISIFGCKTVTDTLFIKVFTDLFIPNAFTPNADGLNDTWNIPAIAAYPNFQLLLYNRYGQLIFETKTSPVAWNGSYKGKPCPNGAYTYIIKTGKSIDLIKGTVMIIR